MNIYRKILGILSMVFLTIATIFLIYLMINQYGDNREIIISLFIPIYVIIHYIILTKFGFNMNTNNENVYNLITSIIIIIVLLVFPVRVGIEYFQTKKNNEKSEYFKNEITEKRKKLKVWKNDVNITKNISGELKTKYEFGKIFYQLKIKGLKKSIYELSMVFIQFEDKDDFIINTIRIPLNTDSNITSMESNDSLFLEINSAEEFNDIEYDKISSWELISKDK
jgi:hypothetical protein